MQDRSSGWIGTVLQDKWHIEAKIARGGVATVFRARHRQGQVAAIKIMHPQLSRNEDIRRRFLREGYAANKVGHSGVVRVLDDDMTDDGTPFIVMELLDHGELLEERRERLGGRLPLGEVIRICDKVLDVLASAHDKGIIHRDIKPDNIFLLADGAVKVLDFGIAHIKEAALAHEPTATGLLLGTPEFMAPEQALGKRGLIDAQTDIYALGATMFTLLSGEAVHVYDTLNALLTATSSRQARSLASVAFKGIPRDVIAVVDKALALDKQRRWPSARAMQDALRSAAPVANGAHANALASVDGAAKVALPPPPRASTPASPSKQATVVMPPIQRPPLPVPAPPSGRGWVPTGTPSTFGPAVTKGALPPSRPPPRASAPPLPSLGPTSVPTMIYAPPSAPSEPSSSEPTTERFPPASETTAVLDKKTERLPAATDLARPSDTELPARTAPHESPSSQWTDDFATGEVEGPTVALGAKPVQLAEPAAREESRGREAETSDDDETAAMLHTRPGFDDRAPDPGPAQLPNVPTPAPPAGSLPAPLAGPELSSAPSPPAVERQPSPTTVALLAIAGMVIVCLWFAGCLFLRSR